GAYRFLLRPGTDTVTEVKARLFLRENVTKLGMAPLTTMYFFGENQRSGRDDYRPEVHDSDGLSMQSGTGEWIWRPLVNPKRLLGARPSNTAQASLRLRVPRPVAEGAGYPTSFVVGNADPPRPRLRSQRRRHHQFRHRFRRPRAEETARRREGRRHCVGGHQRRGARACRASERSNRRLAARASF